MMLDENIVAVSPSTTYRVLAAAGHMRRWNNKTSKKGNGFIQPLKPHEHWHTDISYLNLGGTFFFLISVLDGCSRYIISWDIRPSMTEADVEIVLQKAHEQYPAAKPRIISDNGGQFIAKDFKEFIRGHGMTHVRTSPNYPQSNGKIERFHKSLKEECLRRKTPLTLTEAKRIVAEYIKYYNNQRLHSSLGFIAPLDRLQGRAETIFKERNQKLERAREQRKINRQIDRAKLVNAPLTNNPRQETIISIGETEASSAEEQLARDNRLKVRRNVDVEVVETDHLISTKKHFREFSHTSKKPILQSLNHERDLSNSR